MLCFVYFKYETDNVNAFCSWMDLLQISAYEMAAVLILTPQYYGTTLILCRNLPL